ncbi:cation channel sperm-associated auxiliary subunit delta isoform X3 [Notamacropus eugenii]|uniref:cation channel sperm-associated auxiliary subunit delta isoform X3 n=1 Tax=Notamacropus eugenii TaxID=9315 RepID=UPI003B67378F
MALSVLTCPWAFAWLLVVVAPWGQEEVDIHVTSTGLRLCSPRTIRTGKTLTSAREPIEEILYYAYDKPQIVKHPCVYEMALYMGKRLFLTRDNFHRSLVPLNFPRKFKVMTPKVSAALFSASSVLLLISGKVFIYYYEENLWSDILVTDKFLTDISAEHCCYSSDFSCVAVSFLILVYTTGNPASEATIYMSRNLGFEFEEIHLLKVKHLNGTLEGFFFFHSISKFAVLLRTGNMGRFVFMESSGEEVIWGIPFHMPKSIKVMSLPGLKGFLILWAGDHLFFSHNNDDNELALGTSDADFYYGTLGLLSTSITKVLNTNDITEDSAMMFESVGLILIVTPQRDEYFQAFDFLLCDVNMQHMLMHLSLGLKTCKAEILRGDFNKKVHILDMGETLELSAKLVSQPSQSPIPIVTVSNPHTLGFKVKMYEDGYTYDGNTKFTINITLMQQHRSGRAHESFISNLKLPSLSTITLDLIDRGMSCIDLQPPSGIISIGCNWKKYIQVHRNPNACMKKFLEPAILENSYTYTLEKGAYDTFFQFQIPVDEKERIVKYDYAELGCPSLVYYNSPWKPVIELWEENNFVEIVTSEFILLEVHGLRTYTYSLTAGQASCISQPQNWSSMLHKYIGKKYQDSWNRMNYMSCYVEQKDSPLLWPDVEYQILGGATENSIIFDQRNGIYVFLLRIVDPHYSYCDLTTTFSIYVYGAFPKQTLPDYSVAIGMLIFMLFLLWLGYIIPKLFKSERGRKFKSFFQNLCSTHQKEKRKFHLPKVNK